MSKLGHAYSKVPVESIIQVMLSHVRDRFKPNKLLGNVGRPLFSIFESSVLDSTHRVGCFQFPDSDFPFPSAFFLKNQFLGSHNRILCSLGYFGFPQSVLGFPR